MSHLLNAFNTRAAMRLALAGVVAALLSGCSSDASRLSNPFGNPFAESVDPLPTRSIAGAAALSAGPKLARLSPVTSNPLAGLQSRAALPAVSMSPALAYNQPPAISSARVLRAPQGGGHDVTGSISPRRPAKSGAGGWSADGGTPIVAAQGESAAMLARRYGVPEDALLNVNGFNTAAQVQPGTRLIVPVYNAGRVAPPAVAQEHAAPVALSQAAPVQLRPQKPRIAKTDTAATPAKARLAAKPQPVKAAAAEPVPGRQAASKPVDIRPAMAAKAMLAKPAAAKANVAKANVAKPLAARLAVAKIATPKAEAPKIAKLAKAEAVAPAPVKVALAKPVPVKSAKVEKPVVAEAKKPVVDATPVASLPAAAPAAAESANPEFRWPARGRIIQGFKAGGNDGINIAVPEGTSVKAAEGGVVAYAGSELKGYGNLVLIRHPNGFVSAYANNGDIEVKRGDNVKRGQTIAKSGQSGNVSSPQLHFELRKGATPVDPTGYLAGL